MKKLFIGCLLAIVSNCSFALTVYLPEEINDDTMRPLFKELAAANKNDTLTIVTDSFGGNISTMAAFLDETSKFRYVIAEVNSFSASAAAVITALADEVHIHQNAMILFHRANCGDPAEKECEKTIDEFNQGLRKDMASLGFTKNALDIMFEDHKDLVIRFDTNAEMTGSDVMFIFNLISDKMIALVHPSDRQEAFVVALSISAELQALLDSHLTAKRTEATRLPRNWASYILTGNF